MSMLNLRRDQLMLSLRPADAVWPIPPASDRRAWDAVNVEIRREALARADGALKSPPEPLTATLLLSGAPYIEAHRLHRAHLNALIVGACVAGGRRYLPALCDTIWAALERTAWSDPDPELAQLPDPDALEIDLAAAETACALALAARLLEPELRQASPAFGPGILRALHVRIFAPLTAERTLHVAPRDLLPALDALISCVLLTDFDSDRRWLCVRYLCGLTERHLRRALPDGGMQDGLERHVPDACALSNLLTMLSLASGGEVELRDEPLFSHMAALPAALHVGGGWFANHGGDSPRPKLDPDALFLLGDSARLSELCALAAYLSRMERDERSPLPIMQELQRALFRNLFLRESVQLGKRTSVNLPAMQLLSARAGSFYACLIGGANVPGMGHLDVGELYLFYGGKPIIVDPGTDPAAAMHSVPEASCMAQAYTGLSPLEGADCRFDPGLTLLSIGIAHAYPKACGLLSWQRSVMMSQAQHSVRLMDAVDFDHGQVGGLAFQFITPQNPRLMPDRVLLGDVTLFWEGALIPSIERVSLQHPAPRAALGPTVYRLRFETEGPVAGGNFAFVFRPSDAD